jgi:hypothetical protein
MYNNIHSYLFSSSFNFYFMKKFRLMLAAASLLILLFCGTEVSAQSDYSGVADVNVKQLVQVGNLDLVDKTEAISRLADLKVLIVEEASDNTGDDLAVSIKYSYLSELSSKMNSSNDSTEAIVEASVVDLLRVANRFKSVDSATLSSVFNEIVAELEE